MADYYSVLARAVVNLETEDAAAREELYERARSIIVAELRKQNPRISALTVTREQAALEVAIRRLETELRPKARDGDRKSGAYQKAEPVEAERLRNMPKALAAMLFGTCGDRGVQRRRLPAWSGARLRRYHPVSDTARCHGRSRVCVGSAVA